MTVTIIPDECLPDHISVVVVVNGIRGERTGPESESDRYVRLLTDAILNRKQEDE